MHYDCLWSFEISGMLEARLRLPSLLSLYCGFNRMPPRPPFLSHNRYIRYKAFNFRPFIQDTLNYSSLRMQADPLHLTGARSGNEIDYVLADKKLSKMAGEISRYFQYWKLVLTNLLLVFRYLWWNQVCDKSHIVNPSALFEFNQGFL